MKNTALWLLGIVVLLTGCESTPDLIPPAVSPEEIESAESRDGLHNQLIGLSVEAAQQKARNANRPFRVVEIDGKSLAVTMDYRIGRINASVESGIVVGASVEGGGELGIHRSDS